MINKQIWYRIYLYQKDDWKILTEMVELSKARFVTKFIRKSLGIKTRIYRVTMEKVKQ